MINFFSPDLISMCICRLSSNFHVLVPSIIFVDCHRRARPPFVSSAASAFCFAGRVHRPLCSNVVVLSVILCVFFDALLNALSDPFQLPVMPDDEEDQDQNSGCKDHEREPEENGNDQFFPLPVLRRLRDRFRRVRNAMTGDQESVGVDAVWRTGHERDQISSLFQLNLRQFTGQYDFDTFHLISECLIQHADLESVPDLHLIDICK